MNTHKFMHHVIMAAVEFNLGLPGCHKTKCEFNAEVAKYRVDDYNKYTVQYDTT